MWALNSVIDRSFWQELDLTLSSDFPYFLLQALPFALVSEADGYIGNHVIRNNNMSSTVMISKYYYKPHIEDMKRQLNDAKDLGTASAEEWTKGLACQGQHRLEGVLRWEQWEAKGGLKKVNSRSSLKTAIPAAMNVNSKHFGARDDDKLDRSNPHRMAFAMRLEPDNASPVPLPSADTSQVSQKFVNRK